MAENDFQKKVSATPDVGLPGQLVDGYYVPTAITYVSNGELQAGQFAFAENNKNDEMPLAHNKKASGICLGVVLRALTGMLESPFIAGSNKYAKNTAITIAARGRVYFKVEAGTPALGNYVIVDPADGAVTFNADAATTNNTGWQVVRLPVGKSAAAAGDIVIIENLG